MSPLLLSECDPVTRANVLQQIHETEGNAFDLNLAVTISDEPQLLPASMADEPLAEIVVSGCKKFRTLIPYVIELRKRFNSKIRGSANIAGCKTWTEFCEKHLDRTTGAVQRAITVHTNRCLPPTPNDGEPAVPVPVPSVCPDCGESFPTRGRLKKHGRTLHDVPTSEISKFLRRASGEPERVTQPAALEPQEYAPCSDSMLNQIEITPKNVKDTRCLSMAQYRLHFCQEKVFLLFDALDDAEIDAETKDAARAVLRTYLRAFRGFAKFSLDGADYIEKQLAARPVAPVAEKERAG